MLDRIRRQIVVAIDGTLLPAAESTMRIERAWDELTLYRDIAAINRTDRGIARAASRWGLLVRMSANVEPLAKQLGAYFSARREEWLVAPRVPQTGAQASDGLLQATGKATLSALETAVERVRREYEVSDEDMAALWRLAAGADLRSKDGLRKSMTRSLRTLRGRHPKDGPVPRWARDLDQAGDLNAQARTVTDGLDAIGRASTPRDMAKVISAVRALLPATSTIADDDERNAALAPLIAAIEQAVRGEPPTQGDKSDIEPEPGRALGSALLAYWRAADTPGVLPPEGVLVPRLADPDTWRTVVALWCALPRRGGGPPALPPERASDWRAFSIECALWRDAIDALQRAEYMGLDADVAGQVRDALWVLADRVGTSLGLPSEDLAGLDPADPAIIGERLLRWIAARCALAGMEPRPRGGAVGTEGRALWSIYDALTDAAPPRSCAWPECHEPLPPRSYAHRRYCDMHLRKRAAVRMARSRAAKRAATAEVGMPG